ncbi:hypothetical protein KBD08_04355, partial [Candidatus Babeliales bacterium]|nr:hypothetical protein [Candidatus Babeliales bacterium]
MKKYILSLLVTIPCMLQSGFGGFAANTASDNYMSTLDASRRALPQAASTTSTSTSTSTTQCPTQNTAGYYLQPFQVQLTNENNTI